MIRLELEVFINKEWSLEYEYFCNTITQAKEKIKSLKQRYALQNKEFRVFVVYQSKMNTNESH